MKRVQANAAQVLLFVALSLFNVATVFAQETPNRLGTGADAVMLPSVGRILLAFGVAAGLAVAAGMVLRRLAPKFAGPVISGKNLRVLERVNLGADLKVHLVETDHGKVLIAAHRNNISMIALDAKAQDVLKP